MCSSTILQICHYFILQFLDAKKNRCHFSHSEENTNVESCPCLGKMDKMFRRLDNFWQLAADGSSDIRTRDRYWLTWFIKKAPNHILLFIFITCASSIIEKWFLNKNAYLKIKFHLSFHLVLELVMLTNRH